MVDTSGNIIDKSEEELLLHSPVPLRDGSGLAEQDKNSEAQDTHAASEIFHFCRYNLSVDIRQENFAACCLWKVFSVRGGFHYSAFSHHPEVLVPVFLPC